MALTRTKTWTIDLPAFVAGRKDAPFAWGSNDCCLLAADGVQALTGEDIAADFRDKYSDEATAFALIHTLTGGATIADAADYCAAKAGLIEWKFPLLAQRGDLVVVQDGTQQVAGIINSDGRYAVSAGPSGRCFFPLSKVTRAWKV